jgi:ferredoxin-type protein NapH
MDATRTPRHPGADAIAARGWLSAHKWLLLRRCSQLGVLTLFLLGPLAGIWIVKGNLNFSYTLGVLPLTDLLAGAQTLAAGHVPETLGLLGLAIVLLAYLVVGGRSYCAWVCPLNPVTDAAAWLRGRLGLKSGIYLSDRTRYWVLGMTLLLAAASGRLAWELVNPISMLHRGLIFGMGWGWVMVLAVFFFDLLLVHRGWCGHVCPTGVAYSLLGHVRLLRVKATRRDACDDCADCYLVCPEPKVIRPALKGEKPVIASAQCTHCGRCIDVCPKDVFSFGSRFEKTTATTGRP